MHAAMEVDVPAVFPNREEAEVAVDELMSIGLAGDHLWRMVRSSNRHIVDEDSDRIVLRSVVHGIALGMPIGAVAGMVLVFASMTLAGVPPTAWAVVSAGGFGGFMAGIFFGVVVGVARKGEILYAPERYSDVPLAGDEVLVVAHALYGDVRIHDIFERHHGHEPALKQAA